MPTSLVVLVSPAMSRDEQRALGERLSLAGGQSTVVNSDDETIFLPSGIWLFRGDASNEDLASRVESLATGSRRSPCSFLVVKCETCHQLQVRDEHAALAYATLLITPA